VKIGDGGLQGMVTHDDVTARQARERQIQKPDGTEEAVKQQEAGTQLSINALNKAVEKLNENAQAHNLPLEFSVKNDEDSTAVIINNTQNGNKREVTPEELPKLLKGMDQNIGMIIDEYF
jgi:uncharacterized FlaG/YvyC family protein